MCYQRGKRNENNIKKFYIIWRDAPLEGLFSYVNNFLWHIMIAVKNDWIPIIDMQNHKNSYLDDALLGKENAYEYYFEQPMNYSLNDICHDAITMLCKGEPSPIQFTNRRNTVKRKWKKLANKYIKINELCLEQMNEQYDKLGMASESILGVNIRSTDYVSLNIKGLPKQPDNEIIIEKCHKIMKRYGIKKIFMCCDNEEAIKMFKKEFGEDTVLVNERKFYPLNSDLSNPMINFERENDTYLKGLEYLTSVYLLSRCDYLVGGLSGASVAAQLLKKNKYKKIYIWRSGYIN